VDAIELRVPGAAAQRPRGHVREIVVVAIGVLVGLAIAFGPGVFDDSGGHSDVKLPTGAAPLASLSTRQVARATAAASAIVAAGSDAVEPPAAPAPTPLAAVEDFVQAEIAGRYDLSYGLLSAPDRAQARSRVSWTDEHADLPPLTGFTPGVVVTSGATATVPGQVDLRATLDEVVGLVPAHADARFAAVAEDGGWRVAYADSRLTPVYPSIGLAVDAARAWVTARQQCRTADEWSGGLVGSDALARGLCGRAGAVRVGTPVALPNDPSVAALTAAFGPDAEAWARVVPVTAPARVDLIVAPVGEQWLVVGATTASASAP
jgi:hypothetical protein